MTENTMDKQREKLIDLICEYHDTWKHGQGDWKSGLADHILADEEIKHAFELLKAEKEGRLIVPPCKVGDNVWAIRDFKGVKHPQQGVVSEMFFTRDMELMIVVKMIARGHWGKTVFLSREEAEKALNNVTDTNVGNKGVE